MGKKVFLILIVLSVVLSSFLVVSASEVSYGGLVPVDVLDYGTYNDSGRNYGVVTSDGNYQFYYKTPLNFTFWYVDLIIEVASGSTPITSLSEVSLVGTSGTVAPLTFKHLGEGVYRIYGELPNRFVPTNIGVRVVPSNGLSRISIVVNSFLVYTLPGTAVPDRGEIQSYNFSGDTSWKSMSSPGQTIGGNFYSNLNAAGYLPYTVQASSVNWRSFDYIDFQFRGIISTIDSICVQISKSESTEFVTLPFEVGWVNGTAIGPNTYVNQSGSYAIDQLPATSNTQINLRVFIPNEYRSYGSLFVIFNGQYPAESGASNFALDKVTGFYNVHDYDPQLVKLDQIRIAIENNLSAPPGAADSAANAAGTASGQQSTVQSGLGTLNSYDRPEIGDFGGIDFDHIASSNGLHLLNIMLNPIKENPIILGSMMVAVCLAVYGFIIFGKKG